MIIGNMAWSFAYAVMSGVGYLERRWRFYLLWTTLPDLLLFYIYFYCKKLIAHLCKPKAFTF